MDKKLLKSILFIITYAVVLVVVLARLDVIGHAVMWVLGGVEQGMVLDGGGDDVAGGFPLEGHELHHALEGPVVRLGAAGGEEELLWLRPDAGGDVGPGLLQVGLGLLPKAVEAGGVAVALGQIGVHGLQRGAGQGGGARVVGIDETGHGCRSLPKY